MLLLPDFTAVRPNESDAIAYAVALVARYEGETPMAVAPYCLSSEPCPSWGGAYLIKVACGAHVMNVDVWLEARADGTSFLYGEY